MKRILVVCAVLSGLGLFAAPLKVGLYADLGCRGAGVARWAEIIDGSPDAELTLLSGADLRAGRLAGLDLLVGPGGAGGPQYAAMGDEGAAAVRKFVADGGLYLGTCCGFANLLNEDHGFAPRLKMVPFEAVGATARGGFTATLSFNREGAETFGIPEGDVAVRYHNGPIVRLTDPVAPCSNVVVLATMNCELAQKGPVKFPMYGTPGVVKADYGKGRLVLFNCHPEIHADTRPLVAAAFKALTGRAFRLPAAASATGRERVAVTGTDMTKPVLEKYLALKRDPRLFVAPLTRTEIENGYGEVFDRIVDFPGAQPSGGEARSTTNH